MNLSSMFLKVHYGSYQDKIKVLPGLYFFLLTLGENLFPCLFQRLDSTHIPWLVVFFLHHQSQKSHISLTLSSSVSSISLTTARKSSLLLETNTCEKIESTR